MTLEWMKIESEYLNILAHEKGLVTISDMEEREPQIFLWQGDITRLAVDTMLCSQQSIAWMFCSKS